MKNNDNFTSQQKIPSKQLHKLQVFIGKWQIEGENLDGAPIEVNSTITGETTYEWLPGKFFVINMWDNEFSESAHKGIGVIGFDPTLKVLTANNYDNMGFARIYEITSEQNIWKFTGDHERGLLEFASDGNSFVENWEILDMDSIWQPLCILKATKI